MALIPAEALSKLDKEIVNFARQRKTYTTVIGLLQQVTKLLTPVTSLSQAVLASPNVRVVNISAASMATPIGGSVRVAIIQNITTNPVTLGDSSVKVGVGFILNGADSSGKAGDAWTAIPPVGADLVDLSHTFFTQTGTGATLSVIGF